MEDPGDEPKGLLASTRHKLLTPVRIAVSKPAQRAYITSILFISTSLILLWFATTAYALFYSSYIPRIGFERTVHLQFDNVYNAADGRSGAVGTTNLHPYGTVSLAPDVVSVQQYDVLVELSLPRTRANRETGNFMIVASMLAPGEKGEGTLDAVRDSVGSVVSGSETVLARSRRPAMLTYYSPIVEQLCKLSELHWYLLGWRKDAELLRVSMFEGVEFPKGWRNVPATLKLEVQSSHQMQIYEAKVEFRARFHGLRWLMYNHRVASAFVFIGGFWTTEMVFTAIAWALLTLFIFPKDNSVKEGEESEEGKAKVKQEITDGEEPDLSDTERTFPTLAGQKTLRYSSPSIKQEDDAGAVLLPPTPKAIEADDEDEDADFFLDSGLGTSMESSATRRESMRKRRSRVGSGDAR